MAGIKPHSFGQGQTKDQKEVPERLGNYGVEDTMDIQRADNGLRGRNLRKGGPVGIHNMVRQFCGSKTTTKTYGYVKHTQFIL